MKERNNRLWFTLVLLLTGGISTILMLLLASSNAMLLQGLTEMPKIIGSMNSFAKIYIPFVWIPSLILFFIMLVYGKKKYPEITRRVWIGIFGGIVATFALDTFRQLGVINGWLPVDTIMMFGKMIAGPKASELTWIPLGLVYHFLNGMSFGVIYVIIFGGKKWTSAIFWALLIEIGMMTLPPMLPVFGAFGSKTGSAALFIITLIAHLAFGVILGVWTQKWLKNTT